MASSIPVRSFFFFNDTATTEIYTLSLHDALPISRTVRRALPDRARLRRDFEAVWGQIIDSFLARYNSSSPAEGRRSEEHTAELQSRSELVCRLLPEKKKHQPQQDLPHLSLQPARR